MTEAAERELLRVDNARNLTPGEMLRSFYVTSDYRSMLAPVNQVILGARGSGKTTLLRMLSHDLMRSVEDSEVRQVVKSAKLIGIYVPMSATWVSSLASPDGDSSDACETFRWRLNVASCIALTGTAKSCLEAYIVDVGDRARAEVALVKSLSEAWDLPTDEVVTSLADLKWALEEVEYRKLIDAARARALGEHEGNRHRPGLAFETDLFAPLKRATKIVGRDLRLPDETMWALCLDEAEFLQPEQHQMINTHMRSHPDNLVFKLSTLPYYEPTLKTETGDNLSVGHDLEYLYIDRDPVGALRDEEFTRFLGSLFSKRVSGHSELAGVTLAELLGPSPLLDVKQTPWGEEEERLLVAHASSATVDRARRLGLGSPEFGDQIARKVHGALLLRAGISSGASKGRLKSGLYSGEATIIRCSDANPRRMLQLLGRLLRAWGDDQSRSLPMSAKRQNEVLVEFSRAVLNRTASEPGCGAELHGLLTRLLAGLRSRFYDRPLTTDQVFSVEVSETDGAKILELIRHAAAIGLLYPNIPTQTPEFMPREGVFHFAYVLAPAYGLLPRRGTAVRVSTLLRSASTQRLNDAQGQARLWGID